MAAFPEFNSNHFELIAKELGEVLTGSRLDKTFANCGIKDVSGESTKWRRIYTSLLKRQEMDKCGNNVAAFIMEVMSPAKFVNNEPRFINVRNAINKVLVFDGLEIGEDGKFRKAIVATTISEAKQRVDTIASRLKWREIHPEVLKYCKAELMQENYFHAVFEAAKSVTQRIRDMTGLHLDGAALIDKAFAESSPIIWINAMCTETEKSEHKGFALLIKGAFVAIRNPTAHEPKILWQGEEDAADYFTLLSLIHRKLDKAKAQTIESER